MPDPAGPKIDISAPDATATGPAASSSGENRSLLPPDIGQYRIIRLLGEGGMGAVYEAEQQHPHRLVALKVVRAGYASADTLRRFETETEALGRLQHPGIAQIYDAGTADTPFGRQPYFAMELVHGRRLLTYCDEHSLNLRQRLELFVKVCDAIQHAHQRGLIHRDLKPANILVDESGQPKILDFGIARLTDSDAQATRRTDLGQIVGTLAYMSPEQVLGDSSGIDTRSDVYALGIILYELLAGKLPYTISRQLPEVVRTIREEEPARLSSVNRIYRGDLETIVAKALEKDRARRYNSPAELAGDISRYLRDEPIVARPPSATYQLRKFARRHKALVMGVAAVLAVLLLGVVASTWQAVKARRAQREAEKQAAIAGAVNTFLQNDLLAQASAYNQSKPDPNITVKTVLDRAAQNVPGKFKGQPAVEAAIRQTIASAYGDLGLYSQQYSQLQQALRLSKNTLGPHDPKTLAITADLAGADSEQGNYAEAEALLNTAIEGDRRVLGPQNQQTVRATSQQAGLLNDEGKSGQAEALDRQVLDIDRRDLGPESRVTIKDMSNLTWVYINERKYPEAEALGRQALDLNRKVLGAENPNTLNAMDNLAIDYVYEDKFDQAEALDRQIIDTRRRVQGPEDEDTLLAIGNLSFTLSRAGKLAEAEALSRQYLETLKRALGPEHPNTLSWMNNLGYLYQKQRKYAQAEPLLVQTLALRTKVLGPAHPYTIETLDNLANVYMAQGRSSQAEELCRTALSKDPNSATLLNEYAWILLIVPDPSARRPVEALELSRKLVQMAPNDPGNFTTMGFAEARNKLWDEAIVSLNRAIQRDGGSEPTDYFLLAIAFQGRGETAEAEKNYDRGASLAAKNNDPQVKMLWTEAAEVLHKPAPTKIG